MARNANGSVFALGHWEAMEIGQALSEKRERLERDLCQGCKHDDGCYDDGICPSGEIKGIRNIESIFTGEFLFSVIRNDLEW